MNARWVAHHGLSPTKRAAAGLRYIELVPERRQFAANGFGNLRFDTDIAALESAFRKASRLQRFLNVEAIIRNIRDELGVSLGLIESTHDSKTNTDAVLLHEGGNNRVQWPLARGQRVGVVRLQCEQRTAVMQDEARAGRNEFEGSLM